MEETFAFALSIVMAVLGFFFVWRSLRARREARRRGPVRGRVVHVEREPRRTRTASWLVSTRYEVPGDGVLDHRRWFEDEGPAILWQRLHREGSEHDVYPNRREPGTTFVVEDLEGFPDWPLVIVMLLTAAMGAWALWFLADAYWLE